MRRYFKRGLPLGLLLLTTFFYPLLAPPAHRIDQVHFDRITIGMTHNQVEAIFGVPAGEYDWAEQVEVADYFMMELAARELYAITEMTKAGAGRELVQSGPYNPVIHGWASQRGVFMVSFDEQNRVVSKTMSPEIRIVPPWQRCRPNWRK